MALQEQQTLEVAEVGAVTITAVVVLAVQV
jgi:hypothetical protein